MVQKTFIIVSRKKLGLVIGLGITSCVVGFASVYMRKLLEEKIYKQPICESSMNLLLQHQESMETLGSPINFSRPNMRNTFNNITHTNASIAIPVKGSITEGNLLISASKREIDREWSLDCLKLQMPKEKIVVKEKPKEKIVVEEMPKEKMVVKEKRNENIVVEEISKEKIIVKETHNEKIVVKEIPKEKIVKENPNENIVVEEIPKGKIVVKEKVT